MTNSNLIILADRPLRSLDSPLLFRSIILDSSSVESKAFVGVLKVKSKKDLLEILLKFSVY